MFARGSRRRWPTFTSSPRVTTSKPPSRHWCQTGERSTRPSRRYVASTATSGCSSRSPSSSGRRSLRIGGKLLALAAAVPQRVQAVVDERDERPLPPRVEEVRVRGVLTAGGERHAG